MKHHGREQEADPLRPSINRPTQPSRLPRQMEIQVQAQQVVKNVAGHLPDRLLRDIGKYGVSELLERRRSYPREAILRLKNIILSFAVREGRLRLVHATMMAPAVVHTVPPRARKSTFMESTMVLKKKGTWTLRI